MFVCACVCVCVLVCLCVYVCIYIYMCVCVCVRVFVNPLYTHVLVYTAFRLQDKTLRIMTLGIITLISKILRIIALGKN